MTDALANPDPWATAAEQLSLAFAERESMWAARCSALEHRLSAALAEMAGATALQARALAAEADQARALERVTAATQQEAELRSEATALRAALADARQAALQQAERQAQAAAEARLAEAALAARLDATARAAEQTLAERENAHSAAVARLTQQLQTAAQDLQANEDRWRATWEQTETAHAQALALLQADAAEKAAWQLHQLNAAVAERNAATATLAELRRGHNEREERSQQELLSLRGDLHHVRQALIDERDQRQREVQTLQQEAQSLQTAFAQEMAVAAAARAEAEAARAAGATRLAVLETMHRAVMLEANARGAAVSTIAAEATQLRVALEHARQRRRFTLRTVRALRGQVRTNCSV